MLVWWPGLCLVLLWLWPFCSDQQRALHYCLGHVECSHQWHPGCWYVQHFSGQHGGKQAGIHESRQETQGERHQALYGELCAASWSSNSVDLPVSYCISAVAVLKSSKSCPSGSVGLGLNDTEMTGNAGVEADTAKGTGRLWVLFFIEQFLKFSLLHSCRKSWGTGSLTAWRRYDSSCHFPSRPEMSSPANLRDPSLTPKAIK